MLKTSIPFIDLRGRSPVDLLRTYPDKARELVRGARRTYGVFSQLASLIALPIADKRSRRWLQRTQNPYLYEIESMAEIVDVPGIATLNLSYEWGCTSGAYRMDDSVSLLRTLDWPFPAIGRHIMVVLQQGKAGEFYNVTWPGLSGVFTGMAHGRFSASLNLAPMRKHGRTYLGDWFKNRRLMENQSALPPSHLLRQVFEKAINYDEARKLLSETPLCVPAIFTLAGTQPGEGCVIERLENSCEIFDLSAGLCVTAANHFTGTHAHPGGWRSREIDSMGRYRQSKTIGGHDLEKDNFTWLSGPIINSDTRLCIIADAASRRLIVQGFEGSVPVTAMFNLPPSAPRIQQAI